MARDARRMPSVGAPFGVDLKKLTDAGLVRLGRQHSRLADEQSKEMFRIAAEMRLRARRTQRVGVRKGVA